MSTSETATVSSKDEDFRAKQIFELEQLQKYANISKSERYGD